MKEKNTRGNKKTQKQTQADEALKEKKFFKRRKLFLVFMLSSIACLWLWRTQFYPRSLVEQAELLIESDPDLASNYLEQAVSIRGGNYPRAQLLWTHALLQANHVAEALGCFSLIDETAVLDGEELLIVAELASKKGVPLLASFALERIPDSSPVHTEAVTQMMNLKLLQGDFQGVEKLGKSIIANENLPAEVWILLAQAYERQLNPQPAFEAYQEYLKQVEEPAQRVFALRGLMNLSIQLGQFEVAENSQNELFSLTEPSLADQVSAAKLHRLRGRNAEALEMVSEVLKDDSSHIGAIELRGMLACDRRDEAAAEADLSRVIELQPWNKQAHYQLALSLQRQGETEAAKIHFERNKYLTQLSLRILELQSLPISDSPEVEAKRIKELANAFEELGQAQTAQQLREGLPQ